MNECQARRIDLCLTTQRLQESHNQATRRNSNPQSQQAIDLRPLR
jgi:hypothetical protein